MGELLSIDGCGPWPVVRPTDPLEVGAIVRAQRDRREAVYPVGGGIMLDYGLPPAKRGVVLNTTGLCQVIDHAARDMTVTVQAGITWQRLQDVLAREGQWLPVDVPAPERMTVGGAIAANVCGPRKLGYGSIRDYLIGISFVDHEGEIISGGGRVVKNVAGYDLMKLQIGALGTLGVITQATFKVRPLPEARKLIRLRCSADRLAELCNLLHACPAQPVGMGFTLEREADCWMLFEEKEETVGWQVHTVLDQLTRGQFRNAEPIAQGVIEAVQQHTSRQIDPACRFIAKLSYRPSTLACVVQALSGLLLVGEPLNGTAWLLRDEPRELSDIRFEVRRAPSEWKTPARLFGSTTPTWELIRHLQRILDPDGVLNPGRLIPWEAPTPPR